MAKSQDAKRETKKTARESESKAEEVVSTKKDKGAAKKGAGTSVIAPHDCKNDYQDAKYGRGNRVFNPSNLGLRCTVCHKGRDGSMIGKLSIRRQLIRDAANAWRK